MFCEEPNIWTHDWMNDEEMCVCLNSSNPKLIQLLIFLSPCTGLRAELFHFQLLTRLHFSLAYFVDVVLTFLKDPVPWGKSPPLVLYFCSLQIIWPRVEHKLLLSPWLKKKKKKKCSFLTPESWWLNQSQNKGVILKMLGGKSICNKLVSTDYSNY